MDSVFRAGRSCFDNSKEQEEAIAGMRDLETLLGMKVTHVTLQGGGPQIPSKDEITNDYAVSDLSEVAFVKERLNEDLYYNQCH